MASNISWASVFLFLLAASAAAYDVTSVLLKHIERLDAKMEDMESNHRAEIDHLKEQLVQQEAMYKHRISELDIRLSHVEEINSLLKLTGENKRVNPHDNKANKTLGKENDRLHEAIEVPTDEGEQLSEHTQLQERIKLGYVEPSQAVEEIPRQRKALVDGYNIAFSAYMDKDADGMGIGQVLIYNQVLLNDGNGYNKHTGIFTAPLTGVYSFSFFVGQRDTHSEWVALWVNSQNKVEAVADTVHISQDVQGGNTVNLKIAAGDAVFVKNLGDGHVEGSDAVRVTTFSGFLIYPVEATTVVGK